MLMNKTEWLNTNELVVDVLKRLGERLIFLLQSNHRTRRRWCVYKEKRTDREKRVCEFTVCVCVCDKGQELETEREEEIKREIGIREREEMRGW